MKAIVLSDWHIHNFRAFDKDGSRLEWCLKVLDDVVDFAKQHNIYHILFAGDLYDNQKTIPTPVINGVIRAFKRVFASYPELNFWAISGNHDYASKNLHHSKAISALDHMATIFDNFVLVDNECKIIEQGITLCGIPYYDTQEDFDTALDNILSKLERTTGKVYLMLHQTTKGLLPAFLPYEVDPYDTRFKAFDFVFAGHIHEHKLLAPNYLSVGNPLQRDRGDIGQDKGFVVVNLRKPENGFYFKHLEDYPVFLDVEEGEDHLGRPGIDYITVKPAINNSGPLIDEVTNFSSDQTSHDLMTTFWESTEGSNKELLQVGLSLLD